jgi:hypothetical protein
MRTTKIVALVTLAVVGCAGLGAAAYAGQSIWGPANPGKGTDHAAMPEAGLEHNQAGAVHPPEDSGQPDDVPPEDAGMPDALPEQASDEADTHFPPEQSQA